MGPVIFARILPRPPQVPVISSTVSARIRSTPVEPRARVAPTMSSTFVVSEVILLNSAWRTSNRQIKRFLAST